MIDLLKPDAMHQWVEERLLPRWQQLEAREQHIVLAAAVLLPLIIIVFGVLLPLADRRDALRTELATVQGQAAEAEQLAQYLTTHVARTKSAGGASDNLLGVVDQMARQTGVRKFMTRIKPQPTQVAGERHLLVSLKDVPYNAMLRFIRALADRHLGLSSLKLQATNNPGYVHAQAVITGA